MEIPRGQLPRLVEKIVCRICKDDLQEEILGDLEEYFFELTTLPRWKRTILFWYQVLHFVKPFALKSLLPDTSRFNQILLLRNYFKTSVRSMMRNPLTSFINIFGLSMAIGICLATYSFIARDFAVDQFHEHKHEVFLATFHVDMGSGSAHYGTSPMALGENLQRDFPSVKNFARVQDEQVIIKHKKDVYHEKIRYADPGFLEMLTFPLKWGRIDDLAHPDNIILSDVMASKYFGYENPIGEQLTVKNDLGMAKTFTIAAVAEPFPEAHAISFDFLVSFENYSRSKTNNWSDFVHATLFQLNEDDAILTLNQQMDKYIALQNESNSLWNIASYEFISLNDLHFRARTIHQNISHDLYYEGRISLPFVAIFMLLLACFNYVNIAIVSAAKRLKEIGLRKVIGAHKGLVIFQFLTENIVATMFALLIGFVSAILLFMPWFRDLSQLDLRLDLVDAQLWVFMIGLLIFTGIISGLYPSIYISRFEVVSIFKGSVKFGQKNLLTKAFLCIQLILAFIAVTGAIVFHENTVYQNNRSWGYDPNGLMYVNTSDQGDFDQMHFAMSQVPEVYDLAGATDHVGATSKVSLLQFQSDQISMQQLSVGQGYLSSLGLKLQEGRLFIGEYPSGQYDVVINELLAKSLNLQEPLGTSIWIDSLKYQVVGVVENFHAVDFYNKLEPTVFTKADPCNYRYLTMRSVVGNETEAYIALRKQWALLKPEVPFPGGRQEEIWGNFYSTVKVGERFHRVMAFMAVLLASLGLYGLIKLNIAGRMREFSVRKVMGAGVKHIAHCVMSQYFLLSIVALIGGMPISYLIVRENINLLYPEPQPVGYSGVFWAVCILVLVLFVIISTQVGRLFKANPVKGLNVE